MIANDQADSEGNTLFGIVHCGVDYLVLEAVGILTRVAHDGGAEVIRERSQELQKQVAMTLLRLQVVDGFLISRFTDQTVYVILSQANQSPTSSGTQGAQSPCQMKHFSTSHLTLALVQLVITYAKSGVGVVGGWQRLAGVATVLWCDDAVLDEENVLLSCVGDGRSFPHLQRAERFVKRCSKVACIHWDLTSLTTLSHWYIHSPPYTCAICWKSWSSSWAIGFFASIHTRFIDQP